MRALVAMLMVVAFAGCTAQEEDPDHPLLGVCPHWEPGPVVTVTLPGNVTPPLHQDGAPLDRFWIVPGSAAKGTLRAFAQGEQRPILDVDEGISFPTISLSGRAGDTFIVGLTSPLHGTTPDPAALVLEGSGPVEVTPLYRICGMLP